MSFSRPEKTPKDTSYSDCCGKGCRRFCWILFILNSLWLQQRLAGQNWVFPVSLIFTEQLRSNSRITLVFLIDHDGVCRQCGSSAELRFVCCRMETAEFLSSALAVWFFSFLCFSWIPAWPRRLSSCHSLTALPAFFCTLQHRAGPSFLAGPDYISACTVLSYSFWKQSAWAHQQLHAWREHAQSRVLCAQSECLSFKRNFACNPAWPEYWGVLFLLHLHVCTDPPKRLRSCLQRQAFLAVTGELFPFQKHEACVHH